jgi:hypothetical protein
MRKILVGSYQSPDNFVNKRRKTNHERWIPPPTEMFVAGDDWFLGISFPIV